MKLRHLLTSLVILTGTAAIAEGPSFELNGVAFTDSAYLDAADLSAATDPYMNRPISFADVQAMLADVQRLYAQAGVVTAQVLLPPQDVADGILRLELVEASIGTIDVHLSETNPEFVTQRLSLRSGEQPDYDAIAADIRMFELAYDVRPTLSFSAGEAFGTSDVVISGDEPDRWGWVVSVDNYAAESLGRWQGTVTGQVRSFSGVRDTLTFSLGYGEGIAEGTLSYRRPIGGAGGTLFGSATLSQNRVVDGQFSVLDVVTDKAEARLGYQRFGFVTRNSYWRFAGDLHYSNSESTLLGEELAQTKLQEISGSAFYHRSFEASALTAGVALAFGSTDTGDVAATDGDFQVLTADLNYARAIGDNWVAEMNIRGQYTGDDTLPSAKLFTVGSLTSARGYPDGVLSGLYGLDVRMQVTRRPMPLAVMEADLTWAPFAFFDAASVQPVAEDSDRTDIRSVGLGVRTSYADNLSFIAMVATPLDDVQGQDIPDGAKAYVGLDYTF